MIEQREICALTKQTGLFVKSHILPKALTKPSVSGAPLLQSTQGKGYKKRFSSWYDKNLVIQQGEDILGKIDDAAIKALRQNMLVWSSWHFCTPVFDPLSQNSTDHSIRIFVPSSPKLLHKFFVSVAWRACESHLPDMKEAFAQDEHVELMRQSIVSETDLAPNFFPVSLIQLTTKGEAHNHTPIHDIVKPPDYIGERLQENSWEIIRIYLDGLIAHVHLNPQKGVCDRQSSVFGKY